MSEEYGWYVLATKPIHRVEFDVATALNQSERATLVPFEEKAIKRRGRRFLERVQFPLYPRYVFVQLPVARAEVEHHRMKALEVRRERNGKSWVIEGAIQGLISPTRARFLPYRLDDEVVGFVRGLSSEGWSGSTKTVLHKSFQVGDMVRIINGPFAGQGAVIDGVKKDRIALMLKMFGAMHTIDVSPSVVAAA